MGADANTNTEKKEDKPLTASQLREKERRGIEREKKEAFYARHFTALAAESKYYRTKMVKTNFDNADKSAEPTPGSALLVAKAPTKKIEPGEYFLYYIPHNRSRMLQGLYRDPAEEITPYEPDKYIPSTIHRILANGLGQELGKIFTRAPKKMGIIIDEKGNISASRPSSDLKKQHEQFRQILRAYLKRGENELVLSFPQIKDENIKDLKLDNLLKLIKIAGEEGVSLELGEIVQKRLTAAKGSEFDKVAKIRLEAAKLQQEIAGKEENKDARKDANLTLLSKHTEGLKTTVDELKKSGATVENLTAAQKALETVNASLTEMAALKDRDPAAYAAHVEDISYQKSSAQAASMAKEIVKVIAPLEKKDDSLKKVCDEVEKQSKELQKVVEQTERQLAEQKQAEENNHRPRPPN